MAILLNLVKCLKCIACLRCIRYICPLRMESNNEKYLRIVKQLSVRLAMHVGIREVNFLIDEIVRQSTKNVPLQVRCPKAHYDSQCHCQPYITSKASTK